ncbi:MAG: PAS domain S-box protein, partial [Deltaproteobacteria bacterium]
MITDKNSEFKILVVDDDPDLLRIIECLLNEQNYIVSTAVSGQECLQAIQLDKPDLILLDVKLPDIGGIDICKTIKSDPELSSIYIVLLSGIKKQSDNISEGLEKGADDYLTKPLKNREFLARIGATFRTIRAEKMLRESESKYRLLTDNMTDAVWLMDMNLKFVYISPSVEKTRGYTLAELRQLSLDQILTPASFQTVMETFSIEIPKILADPSYSPVQVFDLEFYMRDGSIHSLETILSVIRDENGNPINILGQDREITKRKRAEQALQERLKELNCLYSISALMELPDISIDEILNKTLMMLSLSMQFPEITEVRIVLEGKTYQSAHFRETSRMLAREIKVCGKPVGQLEVCYLEDRPSDFRPEPQFMIEEKHLFNAIAGRLGHMIEHKKANIELINAFVRNEALLDAIPDMIFILDSKGVIVDFHTQNHEDLYVQPETFLGKNVADVLPGEVADLFLEKVAAVFTTAQSCQSTYMLEMNGSPKHYESRYVPCGNGQVLAIVRDITDRKQMEQELRKSEERFRHISSTISDISYSCVSNQDSSYSIDWMTGAVEQITGYSIDEIKAMKCWGKLVIDEDLDCFKHHVTGLSHDSTGNCELRLRHKNGAILWVASFAQCIKNQVQPEDIKLYGALVDITTRKQAEAMLHESEEKFRLAFETSPDSIAIIRIADGVIVSVNKGFLQMSGYTHEEVIGKTTSETNNWKDPEDRRKFVEEMQSRGEVRNYEAPLLTNSGEIYGLMSGSIIDLHGEPHILTITRDITERKLTELERQIFYEISLSVSTTKNLNEFLKVIHQSLRKRLYADNCFISLYDQNTDLFSFPYFVDKFDPTPLRAKMRKSVTRHVFRTGEPLLMTPEIFQQLKEQNEVELMGMPASSWIGVPIQAPDRIIGVLVLQHYEENNVYSEKDIKFLTTVGSQIAIVIERKQAEEEIK